MDSVEREAGSVCIETKKENVCSDEVTEFVNVLSKMISGYYANKEEEQV